MNYKLELSTQDSALNIVFNNIVLDSFKINVAERYSGKMDSNPKLYQVLFKVRTLDNLLIKNKYGHVSIKIKGNEFKTYQNLKNTLLPHPYRQKQNNTKKAEQDYVHFILTLMISNYELR